VKNIQTDITNKQNTLEIHDKIIQHTVAHVLNAESVNHANVSIVVVDDNLMAELNQRFHQANGTTDVLSFDLADSDTQDDNDALDCEIIINADRAKQVANDANGQPLAELHLYLVHGLLHQLGYDDQHENDAQRMHLREDQLLNQLGFGDVFTKHQ